MLVLLPPSEGKAAGGDGPPLDLASLGWPALTPVRRKLVGTVQRLARRNKRALRAALDLTPRQDAELAADAVLTTAPTLPALARYTGVLYDALGYSSLERDARTRADASLAVASALFGLLRPTDPIPAYRLSGGTVLPDLGGLAPLWRPALEPVLAAEPGLVVDLRSGAYAALARAPHAVQVRVLRETGGRRTVVSHDNKHTKGRLARALCQADVTTIPELAEIGRSVADDVEVDGSRVDLVLGGLATARQAVQDGAQTFSG